MINADTYTGSRGGETLLSAVSEARCQLHTLSLADNCVHYLGLSACMSLMVAHSLVHLNLSRNGLAHGSSLPRQPSLFTRWLPQALGLLLRLAARAPRSCSLLFLARRLYFVLGVPLVPARPRVVCVGASVTVSRYTRYTTTHSRSAGDGGAQQQAAQDAQPLTQRHSRQLLHSPEALPVRETGGTDTSHMCPDT